MKKKLFFVVTHVAFTERGDIAGPSHSVVNFLEKKRQDYIFIKYPIYGKYNTEIVTRLPTGKSKQKTIGFWENTPIRYLAEGVVALLFIMRYHQSNIVYIGVDPLNSLWGFLGKKLNLVKTFIFFSPDYSRKRFDSNIINTIYHLVDEIAVKNADFIWSVSPRIQDIRLKMGIGAFKNFVVPNAPLMRKIPQGKWKRDSDLVLVANISKGANTSVLLAALLKLKREGKIFKLKIIGAGGGLVALKNNIKKLKLQDQIILKDRMEHKEVYRELQKSRAGVAFYNREEDWTYFCDPMKVRDYLACGLPVIMNDVPYIATDIEKFSLGVVIKEMKKNVLAQSLEKILGDKNMYKSYRQNAFRYAQEYDLEKILENTFRKCKLLL